ncbi:hypothetical protein BGZ46_005801, partial [Entomortierella lignicola]
AGTALIEEMIQAIGKDYKKDDKEESHDRAAMLRTIEQVRNQYHDRIQSNPWLQEQLAGVYWN